MFSPLFHCFCNNVSTSRPLPVRMAFAVGTAQTQRREDAKSLFKHDVFCLQNRLRKKFRFSSRHGLSAPVLASFASFSEPSRNVFRTENWPSGCRKALPAFPEQRFLRLFATRFRPKKATFPSNKALPTLRRGRYCSATGRLRHCNKRPVADQ